ncbi:MAG: UDP-N-acetylglucosamine 2-epimerase (non-hydrolyzing) [Peptococcaceae bacterium]|nr:UDP-N-acetylglucosamine 2-epimerase (non-hydrolyzing) [Peptococcaceae bacterium]
MGERIKVAVVFGTRPEAIKMAPVVKALQSCVSIQCQVTVTAQHREMLDQVLGLFAIQPDHDLDLMRSGQSLAEITTRALTLLEGIFRKERPALVLVHGDTATTFAAALAAYYNQIPVGHVEAGLRTSNKYSPYPEEMNRRLTGAIADWHFAPTESARHHLQREGVDPKRIFVTGNTVIDALLSTVKPGYVFSDPELRDILEAEKGRRMILATTHRRENLGEPMRQIYQALAAALTAFPDSYVLFPMHKNPKVRAVVDEVLGENPRVHLIEPLPYEPFANLMNRAYMVITDSGGIQEEAPSLGKPVLVVRNTTERPEAVAAGTAALVGTAYEDVKAAVYRLLADEKEYARMANAVNPYGDGLAAARILDIIKEYCL